MKLTIDDRVTVEVPPAFRGEVQNLIGRLVIGNEPIAHRRTRTVKNVRSWTAEEQAKLVEQYRANPTQNVARFANAFGLAHGRTQASVVSRLWKLGITSRRP